MDRETIILRMQSLTEARKVARAEAEDAKARVDALTGAIQDCEYWLSVAKEQTSAPV